MSPLNGLDKDLSLPVAQSAEGGCGCSGPAPAKPAPDARKAAAWWRSLGEREQEAEALAFAHREFPVAADELAGEDSGDADADGDGEREALDAETSLVRTEAVTMRSVPAC